MTYDPNLGRWLEEDPIGFDGGDMDLYRFVGNSPANAIDPSGLRLMIAGRVVHKFDDTYTRLRNVKPHDPAVEEILDRMINADEREWLYSKKLEDSVRKELLFRVRVIAAARSLDQTGVRFLGGDKLLSSLNGPSDYWEQGEGKGLYANVQSKKGVNIVNAIDELFGKNGANFSCDCASAVNIAALKGEADYTREVLGKEYKNELGVRIAGHDMGQSENPQKRLMLPGDIVYINNPDYKDSDWRGENLIYLGSDLYYGHGRPKGQGIMTGAQWIEEVQKHTRPGGKTPSFDPRVRPITRPDKDVLKD
jgi:protein-glutamine gamma-glutamyltransferase